MIKGNKDKDKVLQLENLPDSKVLSQVLADVKYHERLLNKIKSTIFTLFSAAGIAILIATIWMPVLQIYGNSMTPTLKSGEMVIAIKTKHIVKGDMIAFYYNNKVLVKRVIATSGQWVNIDKSGTVSVNNKKIEEPYLTKGEKSLGQTNIELPYQVPEGNFFVMGDHRNVSVDSRNTAVGTVSEEQVVGKLTFRIWPIGILKTLY